MPRDDLGAQKQVLPTVGPIARALTLPVDYVFTSPQASLAAITAGLAQLPAGSLLRLRLPTLPDADYGHAAQLLAPL